MTMPAKGKRLPLKRGDKAGIFLPASWIREPFRSEGLAELGRLGLTAIEVEGIFSRNGFAAKDPADAFNDLVEFLERPDMPLLWAGRGGYGSNHLLARLDRYLESRPNIPPKIIIGSSDVSYLLWRLIGIPGLKLLYGPMLFSSVAEGHYDRAQLTELLFGSKGEYEIEGEVLIDGRCESILTGGCLSNFVSTIGTPFQPETVGRILLLEDLNERPYRLDRMFWQIENAGIFNDISGLVLGNFPGCFNDPSESDAFYSNLVEQLSGYAFPVLVRMPLGHGNFIRTVPLGETIRIDTENSPGIRFCL